MLRSARTTRRPRLGSATLEGGQPEGLGDRGGASMSAMTVFGDARPASSTMTGVTATVHPDSFHLTTFSRMGARGRRDRDAAAAAGARHAEHA